MKNLSIIMQYNHILIDLIKVTELYGKLEPLYFIFKYINLYSSRIVLKCVSWAN